MARQYRVAVWQRGRGMESALWQFCCPSHAVCCGEGESTESMTAHGPAEGLLDHLGGCIGSPLAPESMGDAPRVHPWPTPEFALREHTTAHDCAAAVHFGVVWRGLWGAHCCALQSLSYCVRASVNSPPLLCTAPSRGGGVTCRTLQWSCSGKVRFGSSHMVFGVESGSRGRRLVTVPRGGCGNRRAFRGYCPRGRGVMVLCCAGVEPILLFRSAHVSVVPESTTI